MTDTIMLIGSLSNDLFRTASLTQRGSTQAAWRFFKEAKRWAKPLQKADVPNYILKISQNIIKDTSKHLSLKKAERHLMYAILLQNYALHTITKS